METGKSEALADQIKQQGDLVRRLKQEKADKDKVRERLPMIILDHAEQ